MIGTRFFSAMSNNIKGVVLDVSKSSSSEGSYVALVQTEKDIVQIVISRSQAEYLLKALVPTNLINGMDLDAGKLSNQIKQLLKTKAPVEFSTKSGSGSKWYTVDLNATPSKVIFITDSSSVNEEDVNSTFAPADWPGKAEDERFVPVPTIRVPGSSTTRIGYAVFDSPIQHISQQRTSYIEEQPTIRESSTIKRGTGFSYQTYDLSYVATNSTDIKNSVQEVIEQILLDPFVYCEGGPFGERPGAGDIPFHEFVVQSIQISTIPGMPSAVAVDLSLSPFLFSWFCPQTLNKHVEDGLQITMDDVICWPLVKMWTKTRGKSIYNNAPSRPLNGKFVLSLPSQEVVNSIENLAEDFKSIDTSKDYTTFKNLLDIVQHNSNTLTKEDEILTPNIKRVTSAYIKDGEKVFVLKVSSKEAFEKLAASPAYIGLADWSIYKSHNFVDDNGKYLPESGNFDVTRAASEATQDLGFVSSVAREDWGNYSFLAISKLSGVRNTAIGNYYDNKISASARSINKATEDDKKAAIAAPWEYFGVALSVNGQTETTLIPMVSALLKTESEKRKTVYNPERQAYLDLLSQESQRTVPIISCGFSQDEDIVIETVSGTRINNVVPIQVEGISLPIHQSLGGGSSKITVRGKCFSRDAKKKLEFIKQEFDQRCIKMTNTPYGGGVNSKYDSTPFLQVQNEIFQLLGVDFVMPLTLSINSVQEQPHVWDFEFEFLEYNPKTQAAERIKFLPTTLDSQGKLINFQDPSPNETDPLVAKAEEYFSLQYSLASQEIMADKSLPTKAELDYWITLLAEEAQNREAKKPKLTERLPSDLELLDICEDFLQHKYCRSKIAQFKPLPKTDLSTFALSGSWVDPDFYYCYDVDTLWGALIDKAAASEYGERQKDFTPGEIKDPSKATLYREFDPLFNAYTVHKPGYIGSGINDIDNELTDAANNRTFPVENKDAGIRAAKSASEAMDATIGAWWKQRTTQSDSLKGFAGDVPEYLKGEENSASLLTVGTNGSEDSANDALTLAPEIRNDFMNFQWRIQKLKEAAALGWANGSAHYDLYNRGGWGWTFQNNLDSRAFLVPVELGSRSIAYGVNTPFEGVFELERDLVKFLGLDVPSFEVLKTLPEDYVYLSWWFSRKEENASDTQVGWNGILDLVRKDTFNKVKGTFANFGPYQSSNKISFYQKTAIAAAGFQAKINKPTTDGFYVPAGNSATEAMIASMSMFDELGAKYKVDPHIIRAFCLRRTGFGLENIRPDSGDAGWLQLNTEVVPSSANFKDCVEVVFATYAKYLKRFNNIPTLALTATHIELTSKGREKHWVSADFDENLLAAFKTVQARLSTSRYGEAAKNAVNTFFASVATQIKVIIDDYWTAYIEISRVLGSHIHASTSAQRDFLFSPFNAYIVLDVGINVSNVSTSYSPSGERVRIDVGRGEVSRLSFGAKLANDPNLNAEEAALIRIKVDFGLTPHTENAVYSAMLDARKYGAWGRMVQAYPTYSVIIINEGFYYKEGGIKLWDQFYTRGGITNIQIFKTKTDPAHKAYITFSNMFTALTRYSQMEALRQHIAEDINNQQQRSLAFADGIKDFAGKLWNNLIAKIPSKDLLNLWQNNHLQQLALSPGARIQVRLGYGSGAHMLPTVFNGRVVEVPVDNGSVTIVAEGDGWELNKPLTSSVQKTVDGGMAYQSSKGIIGTGTEPSYIVAQTMVPGNMLLAAVSAGRFGKTHPCPHFGDIYFSNGSYHIPELYMNMYGSCKGAMEQQFDFSNQIFNKNAIYNWDQKTLISVSVKEATTWRTAQVCRMAVMDTVTSVEPFHTRSTLFFGRWWYPFNYAYDPSILKFSGEKKETKSTPFLYNRKPSPTTKEKVENVYSKLDPIVQFWLKETGFNDQIVEVFPTPSTRGESYKRTWVYVKSMSEDNRFYHAEIGYSLGATERDITSNPGLVTLRILAGAELETAKQLAKRFTFYNDPQNKSVIVRPGEEVGFEQLSTDLQNKTASLEISGNDPILLRDVQNYVKYLKYKSYMQVWPAVTGLNLINNSISLDTSHLYTDAMGQNVFNGVFSKDTLAKTISFSVDDDIQDSERRTLLVDTGLYVTAAQKGYYESFRDFVGGFTPVVGESIKGIPDTPAVENSVVTALCDSVRTMYGGLITIQGQSSIKPNDLILLNDMINSLEGPVFVSSVTHSLDFERGFCTMINPECVALPHLSPQGSKLITSLSVGPMGKLGQYVVGRGLTTMTGAYLKNRLGSPFNRRIAELNKTIDAIKQSNIHSFYDHSVTDIKDRLLFLIDEKLKQNSIVSGPFTISQERKNLLNLRKILLDSSNTNLPEILRRARDLNLEIPALGLLSDDGKDIAKVVLESQQYHAKIYQALSKELGDTVDPQTIHTLADKKAIEFINKQIDPIRKRMEKSIKNDLKQIKKLRKEIDKKVAITKSSSTTDINEINKLADEIRELDSKLQAKLDGLVDTEYERAELNKFLQTIKNDTYPDYAKIDSATVKAASEAAKAAEDYKLPSSSIKLVEKLKKMENKLKQSAELAEDAIEARKLATAARAAKKMANAIEKTASVASILGPQVVLKVMFEVYRFTIGGGVITATNLWLRARQCVTVIPLRTRDSMGTSIPYTAGLRGHQGAVVGDDISYFDKLLEGWLGGKGEGPLVTAAMVVGAALGIDSPEYGNTEIDSAYLKKIAQPENLNE